MQGFCIGSIGSLSEMWSIILTPGEYSVCHRGKLRQHKIIFGGICMSGARVWRGLRDDCPRARRLKRGWQVLRGCGHIGHGWEVGRKRLWYPVWCQGGLRRHVNWSWRGWPSLNGINTVPQSFWKAALTWWMPSFDTHTHSSVRSHLQVISLFFICMRACVCACMCVCY